MSNGKTISMVVIQTSCIFSFELLNTVDSIRRFSLGEWIKDRRKSIKKIVDHSLIRFFSFFFFAAVGTTLNNNDLNIFYEFSCQRYRVGDVMRMSYKMMVHHRGWFTWITTAKRLVYGRGGGKGVGGKALILYRWGNGGRGFWENLDWI